MAKKSDNGAELQIVAPKLGHVTLCLLGTSPFIFNAMSEKARQTLLLPKGRMTSADKAQNLKHNPIEEYRGSVYAHRESTHPTRLYFPSNAFRKAMETAALDLPGAKKSQIGRLISPVGDKIDFFGIPRMLMSVVRSSDMARTPDIRTRAIVPEWACMVSISYKTPALGNDQIGSLLTAAGMFVGVGDWRQEKGSGSYGQFTIVGTRDESFRTLVKTAGREAQDKALAEPAMHDLETEKLFNWYNEEIRKMGERARKMINGAGPAEATGEEGTEAEA